MHRTFVPDPPKKRRPQLQPQRPAPTAAPPTREERARAVEFYDGSALILKLAAAKFETYLLTEAMVQTAAQADAKDALIRNLRVARVNRPAELDCWVSPKATESSSGIVRIVLTRTGMYGQPVEEIGAVVARDEDGHYFARWDEGVPLKDAEGRRAEHPPFRTQVPDSLKARSAARELVAKIIRVLDAHDPGGLRYSKRVRQEIIPARMRDSMRLRNERRARLNAERR